MPFHLIEQVEHLIVGFRSAAVMAANIPVVVLAAMALVTLFGVELEQISLASIIIALGLLVDNAVQVCDQSRSNQIAGMEPTEATVKGSTQLSTAMLMGTATTVAAFAPMLVGLIGSKREYVYSLPVTLSVTLGISWVLAMSFCTILAATFIRAPKDPSKPAALAEYFGQNIKEETRWIAFTGGFSQKALRVLRKPNRLSSTSGQARVPAGERIICKPQQLIVLRRTFVREYVRKLGQIPHRYIGPVMHLYAVPFGICEHAVCSKPEYVPHVLAIGPQ